MERTRWHTTYQGARRDILLGLAEMPNPNRSAEGYIIDKELDVLELAPGRAEDCSPDACH